MTASVIVKNIMFLGDGEAALLPVVIGSTWFWPVFFAVTMVGSFIVKTLPKKAIKVIFIVAILIYIGLNFMWLMMPSSILKQFIKLFFYLLMFLVGYISHEIKPNKKYCLVTAGICLMACSGFIFGWWGRKVMMELKTPPLFPYCMYAMVAVLFILYYRHHIKHKNFWTWIGKNCLMFYFAQGISSSIIYSLTRLAMPWRIKLVMCFAVNFIIAVIIAWLLQKYYLFINRLYEKIKEKITERFAKREA